MKHKRFIAIIAALLLLALAARAEQFTFTQGFDQIWDYPTHDGSVPVVERPDNDDWTSPVNYYQGDMYMKYEVTQKPSSKILGVQLCFWMPGWSPETCSNQLKYAGTGTYYFRMGDPSKWWQKGDYPWHKNEYYKARLFQKDGDNGSILMAATSCGNYCYQGDDLRSHIPIGYDVEIIVVARGDKLVAPQNWDCPDSWGCVTNIAVPPGRPGSNARTEAAYPRFVNSARQLAALYKKVGATSLDLYTSRGECIARVGPGAEQATLPRTLPRAHAILFAYMKTSGNRRIKAVVMPEQ